MSLAFINGAVFAAVCVGAFLLILWDEGQARLVAEFDPSRPPESTDCGCFECRLYGGGTCGGAR